MSAATREKIFDLFYSSKGQAGTGLGLFIARQVVRQHGGTHRGRLDARVEGRASAFVCRAVLPQAGSNADRGPIGIEPPAGCNP
ncbi:MAG: hypothetical protein MZV70_20020 [Desulfobacterales bacterium]|nr:hypothetical protein [Desulfobacterales bacterium]